MSTTMRPTLQTVPESLPADHVTTTTTNVTATSVNSQPSSAVSSSVEKNNTVSAIPLAHTATTSLKPRSSSSKVSSQTNHLSIYPLLLNRFYLLDVIY